MNVLTFFRSDLRKNLVTIILLTIGFLVPLSDINLTFDLIQQAERGALLANTQIMRITGQPAEIESLQALAEEMSTIEGVSVTIDEYKSVKVGDVAYFFQVEQIDEEWARFRKVEPGLLVPLRDELPFFYTPSFYYNPTYQPQHGDRIRIDDTEYQYGGSVYTLGRNFSLLIERVMPFELEKSEMSTSIFLTYDHSLSNSVREKLEQRTNDNDLVVSYTSGEERKSELITNAALGTFAMLKLSVLIWVAAFLNLSILLFARFKQDRYRLALQAALGERPSSMLKKQMILTYLVFLMTIPVFIVLLPLYSQWNPVLPTMGIHWQTFIIYGCVGLLLSFLYAGLETASVFRTSLASQLRGLP